MQNREPSSSPFHFNHKAQAAIFGILAVLLVGGAGTYAYASTKHNNASRMSLSAAPGNIPTTVATLPTVPDTGNAVITNAPSARDKNQAPSPVVNHAPVGDRACTNLPATQSVRSAVVKARLQGHFSIRPGNLFYGKCGEREYAAARLNPTEGATEDELISSQDEGSSWQYFSGTGGTFTQVGNANFPEEQGCADNNKVPAHLLKAWQNCVGAARAAW